MPQATSCVNCGAAVTGKFCAECGAPSAPSGTAIPQQATATARVAERRITSVLFGDLVGFTTLSESRDPEEVRELLSRYFAAARTVIERYGGTVEKFIGDAVMAGWGGAAPPQGDAPRALRAGLGPLTPLAALGR